MQMSSRHYCCCYSLKEATCRTQIKRHYLQAALDALPCRYYFTLGRLLIAARIAIHAAAVVLLMLPSVLSAPHTAAATTAAAAGGADVANADSTVDTAFLLLVVLLLLLLLLVLLLLLSPLLLLLMLLLMYDLSLWASARAAVSVRPLQHS
jgi:hypothetical protein